MKKGIFERAAEADQAFEDGNAARNLAAEEQVPADTTKDSEAAIENEAPEISAVSFEDISPSAGALDEGEAPAAEDQIPESAASEATDDEAVLAPESTGEAAADSPAAEDSDDEASVVSLFDDEPEAGDELAENTEADGKKPLGRGKKVLIGCASVLALLAVVYLGGAFYFNSHFLPKSEINGMDVTGKTVDEVAAELNSAAASHTLTLVERGGKTEELDASAVNLKYVEDGTVGKLLGEQNAFTWPLTLFQEEPNEMQATFDYDKEKLKASVDQLAAFTSPEIIKVENARPEYKDGSFVVKEEIEGTQVSREHFDKAVVAALLNGDNELNLDGEKCYVAPTIRKDDKELNAAVANMNKYLGGTVTYTFGEQTAAVDKGRIASWLKMGDDKQIHFDTEAMSAYVEELSDTYDTYGSYRPFTTAGGGSITVGGGDYGWLIDNEGEVAQLQTDIQGGQPVSRQPVYAQTAAAHGSNDIGNSYVEISLGGQQMYLFIDGRQVVSTPIVTGNVSAGWGTPSGVYAVTYTARNVTLRGEGYASPVTFWIPFAGDVGIHDASWRSDFGGSIYIGGGSHGCVNTPYGAAQTIFNNVDAGFPVVVY